jgi:hypothetical protein
LIGIAGRRAQDHDGEHFRARQNVTQSRFHQEDRPEDGIESARKRSLVAGPLGLADPAEPMSWTLTVRMRIWQ